VISVSGVDEDAALARLAAQGDERAFGQLMRRHKGSLHAFARRHVGDPEGALEVVQESFVAAWKALGRYDPTRPFGAWMRAIVLNKCRDRGRRLLVRRLILGERSIDAPGAPDHADPALGPEASTLRAEQTGQPGGRDRAPARSAQGAADTHLSGGAFAAGGGRPSEGQRQDGRDADLSRAQAPGRLAGQALNFHPPHEGDERTPRSIR
jgi:RNA polymerase sigma factor (sigma-70 family)